MIRALPNAIFRLPGALLLLGAVACAPLGPDFVEPDVSWLSQWQPTLYGQVVQDPHGDDISEWWRRFHDPVLNTLVEQARLENPELRIAGLSILESRAVLGIAIGQQYPQLQQINAEGAYVSERTSGGINDGDREFRTAEVAFDVAWEMDFWGRFRRGVESADAAYLASVTNQRDVQVLLAAQVASLYYGYKTTLRRIEIAHENVALQERSLEITRQLFKSGQESELDLQQARTQYLATLATIPSLRLGLTRQRNALCALLRRAPGDLPELDPADGQLPEPGHVALVGELPVNLLLLRPDVRTAAWQAAAQSAQVGVAQADLYPAISLFGTVSWQGNSLDAVGDVTTFAAGPVLSWDIFNYGRLRNNVRAQDARLQQALENFQSKVLNAAREVDDAAKRMAETEASQKILDESLVAAERSLVIANRRYREGYSSFQRVLDAQAAAFAQSDLTALNRGEHLAAVIDLYRALGGGWRPATLDDVAPPWLREEMRERTNWGDLLDESVAEPPGHGVVP
ncbi:efflux transporter outer membrane subunit [Microbulbifer agarilyticus]|uniref:efflux transporter outer membrane subunit n=1 Tax=Microbulbifer agarilyticus TaxID=260552 RepID=UPI001C943AC0|nr:efflux transporter outer membrane subunit [Microbulbifer agarilyticus]MBY6211688.1 efflux transporter outer membrane subunit [Microbulbifer agarilyticus]